MFRNTGIYKTSIITKSGMNETLTTTVPEGLEAVLESIGISAGDFPLEKPELSDQELESILNKLNISPEKFDADSLVSVGDVFIYRKKYIIGTGVYSGRGCIASGSGKILIYLLANISEEVKRERLIEITDCRKDTVNQYISELKWQLNRSSNFFKMHTPYNGPTVTLNRYKE